MSHGPNLASSLFCMAYGLTIVFKFLKRKKEKVEKEKDEQKEVEKEEEKKRGGRDCIRHTKLKNLQNNVPYRKCFLTQT